MIQGPLRIASYNIHGCIGRDRRFAPERIAGVIAELDADIVALQEVESRRHGFNTLDLLARETGYDAIAGPTVRSEHGDYGNGLLSRHEVCVVRHIDLGVGRWEPRGAIDVDLRCAGFPLRVLAVHLGLFPGERREQVRRLLHALADFPTDLPTVLLGDINEWWLWGRPLRWLHAHFGETRVPPSFPSRWPLLALDRIWVKPAHLPLSVRVHRSALARMASDHLPICAHVHVEALNPSASPACSEACAVDRRAHADG
jgi:endonuclease/exonuclease/phosphatase family metal-dependent hydrolase